MIAIFFSKAHTALKVYFKCTIIIESKTKSSDQRKKNMNEPFNAPRGPRNHLKTLRQACLKKKKGRKNYTDYNTNKAPALNDTSTCNVLF